MSLVPRRARESCRLSMHSREIRVRECQSVTPLGPVVACGDWDSSGCKTICTSHISSGWVHTVSCSMCRITSRGWVFLASRVIKIPVQLRRFHLLTLSSPLPVDLRATKLPVPVIASAPCLWLELVGRGLRCEARWVWLRRMFPALCRDLCRSASAYECDGGACFCMAASHITSLSSLSGSPVLLARSTRSIA